MFYRIQKSLGRACAVEINEIKKEYVLNLKTSIVKEHQ